MQDSGYDYSVLMSVYAGENPEYLEAAIDSMFCQTVPTDDFVLVCDGPLTDALNQVIRTQKKNHGGVFHVIRLRKNGGLGHALRVGTKLCRHELIARMDSDDLSFPDRCEKELRLFREDGRLGICSGTVVEFCGQPECRTGIRRLPQEYREIVHFSRKRNPFNHPAVMFRKSEALRAGGYSERFHYFEDYYLWVRMLIRGSRGRNHPDPILYMRTSDDMYRRRGGKAYAACLLQFHGWMVRAGWSTPLDFLTGAVPHALISAGPNFVRKGIYQRLHSGQ